MFLNRVFQTLQGVVNGAEGQDDLGQFALQRLQLVVVVASDHTVTIQRLLSIYPGSISTGTTVSTSATSYTRATGATTYRGLENIQWKLTLVHSAVTQSRGGGGLDGGLEIKQIITTTHLTLAGAPSDVIPQDADLVLQVGADLGTAARRIHFDLESVDVALHASQCILGVILNPPQLVLHLPAEIAVLPEQLHLCHDAVEVFAVIAGQSLDLTDVMAQVHHLSEGKSQINIPANHHRKIVLQ